MSCKICGSSDFTVEYEGPIRAGKFGNLTDKNVQVLKCRLCQSKWLTNIIEDQADFYESETYRKEVDGACGVQDYFRMHDGEQLKNFIVAGTSIFRNKIVADIGCGAGSFLDYVKNVCKKTIAIEPSSLYRMSLAERGYSVYPYTVDALVDYKGTVELAVSCSVIEHIEDPLNFLKEIYSLLSSDGKLIISTPNADDLLLDVIPEVYKPFFYRKAHLWYFNRESLKYLLTKAGFKEINITPFHRFGFGNFLSWVRDKAPKGDTRFDYISGTIDSVWKSELERTYRCDYLYAVSTKIRE